MTLRTRMTRFTLITIAAMLFAALPAGATAQQDSLPKSMLLDRLPADAKEVAEAVKTAEEGEAIVLRGRITDGNDVFVPNRAIFRLADETAVPACCATAIGEPVTSGSACAAPAEKRTTIRFLDEHGRLMQIGLNGKHGLGVGKEVFVVGTVHQANQENVLIVNATAMHVPEGNIPFGLFTDDEPDDVKDIPDAKRNVEAGDEVTIRGRIGGRTQPFIDGRAIFTIVGPGPPACSDLPDDHCTTPWDYCCAPRAELRANTATIQLADENGAPLRTDIKGRNGIRELSDLTIRGTVVAAKDGALIVKATKIYVNGHHTD